ncbi:hypothetical protein ACFX2I_028837 [Malus domestica]
MAKKDKSEAPTRDPTAFMLLPLGAGVEATGPAVAAAAGVAAAVVAAVGVAAEVVAAAPFTGAAAIAALMQTATTRTTKAIFFMAILRAACEMAQVSICKAVFVMVIAIVLVSVTAQDSAPAPSPALDAGAGVPVTISGAFVYSSLLLSFFALLRH